MNASSKSSSAEVLSVVNAWATLAKKRAGNGIEPGKSRLVGIGDPVV